MNDAPGLAWGKLTVPQVNHTARCRRRMICIAQGKRVYPPLVFPTASYGQAGSGVSETWACFDSPPEVSAARAIGAFRRRRSFGTGYKQEHKQAPPPPPAP